MWGSGLTAPVGVALSAFAKGLENGFNCRKGRSRPYMMSLMVQMIAVDAMQGMPMRRAARHGSQPTFTCVRGDQAQLGQQLCLQCLAVIILAATSSVAAAKAALLLAVVKLEIEAGAVAQLLISSDGVHDNGGEVAGVAERRLCGAQPEDAPARGRGMLSKRVGVAWEKRRRTLASEGYACGRCAHGRSRKPTFAVCERLIGPATPKQAINTPSGAHQSVMKSVPSP